MKNINVNLQSLPYMLFSEWRELEHFGKIVLKFVQPSYSTTKIPVAFYKGYMVWRPSYTRKLIKRVSMQLWMESHD